MRLPSVDGDGAQAEACLAGGDPYFSLTKHHPLVPDENRLKGGICNHLPKTRAQDHFLGRDKLLAVADRPLGLACHRQRVMGDLCEELDVAGPEGSLDTPEAV